MTERVILDGGSLVPLYAVNFILFSVLYLMFVFGGFPFTSPTKELSFTFLHADVKISFMSMFARFM